MKGQALRPLPIAAPTSTPNLQAFYERLGMRAVGMTVRNYERQTGV
jgi:hypothetical protein